jgi:hypothetical protein
VTRGHQAARRAPRDIDWQSPRHSSYQDMGREIQNTAADVMAETIIAGLREPGETLGEFRDHAWREPARLPDTSRFRQLGRSAIRPPDAALWVEPPWAEPEAEP